MSTRDFMRWLGKQASIGLLYQRPRPAETPAQARKAVTPTKNFGAGVLQSTQKPQGPVPAPSSVLPASTGR